MRIAPVLVPRLSDASPELWLDAVLGTAVTHNDPAAIGSSIAFVGIWSELLSMNSAPSSDWWVDTYVAYARPIEGERTRYEPRGGALARQWSGPLWRLVEEQVPAVAGMPTIEAQEIWYSGAFQHSPSAGATRCWAG